jgi:multicomponent Na+:H+ antiporter subunit E
MRRLRPFLVRIILFAALWLVLSGGLTSDPWVVLFVVIAATVTATWLWPIDGIRVDAMAAIRFVPYFLYQSILGGWDVARRAMQPSMPIDPGVIEYTPSSPSMQVRTLLVGTISLLPGTASVYLAGDRLCVHVLDRGAPNIERLAALDRRIVAMLQPD